MGKFVANMEDYVGYNAFNTFMQIMYEQLKGKVSTTVFEELKTTVDSLTGATNGLTVDDIVSTFEGFDPAAEGADRKVAAASLVKEVKEALEAATGGDADTLGGLGKNDFVKTTDVIASWDNYNADVMQVVAATLIKAISDKVDATDTKVDEFIATKGQANGIAQLDENGKIPSDLIPGSYDDVVDVYAVEETDSEGNVTSTKLYLDAEHTQEVVYSKSVIYLDVTNPDVAGDSYRYSGTALVNLGHPKFKEITPDEVQTMWDSIVVPEETPEAGA